MAAPKKKAPVKKTPKGKKPSFLRKDTSRPARDVKPGDLRDKALKEAQANARSATPPKPTKTGLLRSVGSRVFGAAGAIVDPTFLSGKGEGKLNNDPVTRYLEDISTMSGMNKKMKREIRQGPALAVTGVKEGVTGPTPRWRKEQLGEIKYRTQIGPKRPSAASGFGKRISEGAKFERLRASRAALGSKPEASGATQNRPTTTRPKPMNTKAADYAAMQQGQAKAKSAAPRPTPKPRPSQVIPSAPVARLSRTEREGLSTDRMQRKPKGNLLDFLKKRK